MPGMNCSLLNLKSMKKIILRTIAVFLTLSTLLYLLFSFGTWHINPALWSEEARTMFAILVAILAGLPSIFFCVQSMDEEGI